LNVVVDTSLVVKWLVQEDDSMVAIELLRARERIECRPVMPGWALAEITNVLLQWTIDSLITDIDAEEILLQLPRFVSIVETPPHVARRAIHFARLMGGRSVYDYLFAALAESLDCELWTADESFSRRVGAVLPHVHSLHEI